MQEQSQLFELLNQSNIEVEKASEFINQLNNTLIYYSLEENRDINQINLYQELTKLGVSEVESQVILNRLVDDWVNKLRGGQFTQINIVEYVGNGDNLDTVITKLTPKNIKSQIAPGNIHNFVDPSSNTRVNVEFAVAPKEIISNEYVHNLIKNGAQGLDNFFHFGLKIRNQNDKYDIGINELVNRLSNFLFTKMVNEKLSLITQNGIFKCDFSNPREKAELLTRIKILVSDVIYTPSKYQEISPYLVSGSINPSVPEIVVPDTASLERIINETPEEPTPEPVTFVEKITESRENKEATEINDLTDKIISSIANGSDALNLAIELHTNSLSIENISKLTQPEVLESISNKIIDGLKAKNISLVLGKKLYWRMIDLEKYTEEDVKKIIKNCIINKETDQLILIDPKKYTRTIDNSKLFVSDIDFRLLSIYTSITPRPTILQAILHNIQTTFTQVTGIERPSIEVIENYIERYKIKKSGPALDQTPITPPLEVVPEPKKEEAVDYKKLLSATIDSMLGSALQNVEQISVKKELWNVINNSVGNGVDEAEVVDIITDKLFEAHQKGNLRLATNYLNLQTLISKPINPQQESNFKNNLKLTIHGIYRSNGDLIFINPKRLGEALRFEKQFQPNTPWPIIQMGPYLMIGVENTPDSLYYQVIELYRVLKGHRNPTYQEIQNFVESYKVQTQAPTPQPTPQNIPESQITNYDLVNPKEIYKRYIDRLANKASQMSSDEFETFKEFVNQTTGQRYTLNQTSGTNRTNSFINAKFYYNFEAKQGDLVFNMFESICNKLYYRQTGSINRAPESIALGWYMIYSFPDDEIRNILINHYKDHNVEGAHLEIYNNYNKTLENTLKSANLFEKFESILFNEFTEGSGVGNVNPQPQRPLPPQVPNQTPPPAPQNIPIKPLEKSIGDYDLKNPLEVYKQYLTRIGQKASNINQNQFRELQDMIHSISGEYLNINWDNVQNNLFQGASVKVQPKLDISKFLYERDPVNLFQYIIEQLYYRNNNTINRTPTTSVIYWYMLYSFPNTQIRDILINHFKNHKTEGYKEDVYTQNYQKLEQELKAKNLFDEYRNVLYREFTQGIDTDSIQESEYQGFKNDFVRTLQELRDNPNSMSDEQIMMLEKIQTLNSNERKEAVISTRKVYNLITNIPDKKIDKQSIQKVMIYLCTFPEKLEDNEIKEYIKNLKKNRNGIISRVQGTRQNKELAIARNHCMEIDRLSGESPTVKENVQKVLSTLRA